MATALLDRSGYVPGETITFNAKIDNQSGRTVDGATVQLIRVCYSVNYFPRFNVYHRFVKRETYTAKKAERTYKKILWEDARGKFRDGTTLNWHDFPIAVPNIPPSGLPHCNIIDVEYEIQVGLYSFYQCAIWLNDGSNPFYDSQLVVDPGLLSSNLVVTLGVFIGTIPIRPCETAIDDRTRGPPCRSSSTQFSADCSELDDKATPAEHVDPSAPLGALLNLSIDPSKGATSSNELGESELLLVLIIMQCKFVIVSISTKAPEEPPPSYDQCHNAGLTAGVSEPSKLANESSENNC